MNHPCLWEGSLCNLLIKLRYFSTHNLKFSFTHFLMLLHTKALSLTNQPLCSIGISQVCTQRSWKRPYGVGLLVAGLDESGAHLYYNCPSGNYFEYQAFAIGSRSQAAKTFLERRYKAYDGYTREELIKDALFAIKETLQGEKLTSQLCTVAIVGVGEAFHVIDQKTIQEYIDAMDVPSEGGAEEETAAVPPPSGEAQEGGDESSEPAPMDI